MLTIALNNIKRFKPNMLFGGRAKEMAANPMRSIMPISLPSTIFFGQHHLAWYFLVIPLDNTFNTGLNVDVQYQAIRSAQN